MRAGLRSGALLLLVAGLYLGCRPEAGGPEKFEAWEVGRTLMFENPSFPNEPPEQKRLLFRLQKQVIRSTEENSGLKLHTVLTSLQGQQAITIFLRNGSVALVDPQGKLFPLLPEGFPDRSSTWQVGGYRMKVLGHARWERKTPVLPASRPPEGVWVEGEPVLDGVKVRIFYLPDFGEVEKLEWRDGKWVTTNLMVGWTFQEIPREQAPS